MACGGRGGLSSYQLRDKNLGDKELAAVRIDREAEV
jgi:hypothetical protein